MTMHDVDDLFALHSEPEVREFMRALDRDEVIERLWRDDQDWIEYGRRAARNDAAARGPVIRHLGCRALGRPPDLLEFLIV
ncbi:MAG TPA: hypothetical protein VMB27_25540 [Solirubrobacteraceae bacterium]|nr:hypothetical protein [Solirubrobacteraceae bacterium]